MSVAIRKCVIEDLEEILEIHNHEIINSTALYEYESASMAYMRKWFTEKQVRDFPVFVAEHLGEVAGYATYGTFRTRPAYKYTVEHSVYVHHKHRGNGIGGMLLVNLIQSAKEQGFHVMVGGM